MEANTFLGNCYYNEVTSGSGNYRYYEHDYQDTITYTITSLNENEHTIEIHCWRDSEGYVSEVNTCYLHHWKYNKKKLIEFNRDWLEQLDY